MVQTEAGWKETNMKEKARTWRLSRWNWTVVIFLEFRPDRLSSGLHVLQLWVWWSLCDSPCDTSVQCLNGTGPTCAPAVIRATRQLDYSNVWRKSEPGRSNSCTLLSSVWNLSQERRESRACFKCVLDERKPLFLDVLLKNIHNTKQSGSCGQNFPACSEGLLLALLLWELRAVTSVASFSCHVVSCCAATLGSGPAVWLWQQVLVF